jgi:hypothetical protein
VAAANHGQKKWFHVFKALRQLWRKCSIIIKEALIAFFPSLGVLTPKLFAKVFANERTRIQLSWIVRIFSREQPCSS